MILAVLITVTLLPLVVVMVWRCWNLPPVPAIRLWALGFAGMSANYLDQLWRAEAWENEAERLQIKLRGQRLPTRPSKTSNFPNALIPDAALRFVLPESAVRFVSIPAGRSGMRALRGFKSAFMQASPASY
jgi:hypothetical protein